MTQKHNNRPGSGEQVEPAPEILDGELITDTEYARLKGWNLLPALAVMRVIGGSDRPKTITMVVLSGLVRAARCVARAVYAVGQGHASWARRAVDALTYGPVREQIRLARLAGDREALAEWTERLTALKDGRAQRLRALPATLAAGLRALFMLVCVLGGLLLVVGLWLAFTPGSIGWSNWWALIRHILNDTLTTFSLAVQVTLWAAPPTVLVAAWREGRRAAAPPRWLFSPDERAEADAEITADVITNALAHVKIPALTRFLASGGVLEYVITPPRAGWRDLHPGPAPPGGHRRGVALQRESRIARGQPRAPPPRGVAAAGTQHRRPRTGPMGRGQRHHG